MSTETLKAIGLEDKEVMHHLIKLYKEQAVELIENISKSIDSKDSIELKSHAHTFKGVCLNLGLNTTGEICIKIEECATAFDFALAETFFKKLEASHKSICAELDTL